MDADGDSLGEPDRLSEGDPLRDIDGLPDGDPERLSDKLSEMEELAMLSDTLDHDFAEPQLILPSDRTDTPN